jgi:hypothetical protein
MRTCICDACGKNMMDENRATSEAMTVIVHDGAESDTERRFLQHQLGPYQMERKYEVCWECWLKSLGVKP